MRWLCEVVVVLCEVVLCEMVMLEVKVVLLE